nr:MULTISPECIES: hypothetical protein [unclassified Caulobacter]
MTGGQLAYLSLVIVAFSAFAVALFGGYLYTNLGKK